MDIVVAECELVCIEPDGARVAFTVRIGRPYQDPHGDWRCPVALDGLEKRIPDVAGVDSFQALMLARRLALTLLQDRKKDGARFHEAHEDFEVEIERVFDGGL